MTNYEKLKTAEKEDLAHWMCSITDCGECPAYDLCKADAGRANGFKKWLDQEAEE